MATLFKRRGTCAEKEFRFHILKPQLKGLLFRNRLSFLCLTQGKSFTVSLIDSIVCKNEASHEEPAVVIYVMAKINMLRTSKRIMLEV